MKKLKLPIPKEPHPEPKILSMDEYLKFVEWNLMHTIDREYERKRRRAEAQRIGVKFSFTD